MTKSEDTAAASPRAEIGVGRWTLALVPPLVALIAQLLLGPLFQPSVWLLFYPAVFLSSWIGGLRAGVVSAVLSATAVLWLFLPTEPTFAREAGHYLAAGIFLATGVLFGVFHDRLRGANLRTERALTTAMRANEELERVAKERRIFAALIENSSDFIGIADPTGKPVYVNPAGRSMVGMSPDQPIGETKIPEYYSADQRAFATDVIVKSMIEKGHFQGETSFRNWQTDRPIPVSDTHFMIRDPASGDVLGMGTITRDISDVKELERELREAHADLTRAQSVAMVGSWRLDTRHDVLVWSDENYRIFGVPLGTPMTYGAFLACVHPDDRALVDREWAAALQGKPYDLEHRIVANGTIKWVREKAELEFDEQHALVGGIGITQDVSERKRHEEELRDARERLDMALRGGDLGVWDWNIESGAVIYSAGWAEMRGYRPDEIEGRVETWISSVHADDWARVKQALDEYLQGRAPQYETEHRARTKSGRWIWIRDRGKVFARNARGEATRMVGTAADITAAKRRERDQRLLAEVGALFASTLDYEETVRTIARLAVRELSDFCIVDVVVDGDMRRQTVQSREASGAWICELFHGLELDRSRPHLTREAFETRRPVLVERISNERLESFAQNEHHLRALRAMDPQSLIVAPLVVHGEVMGALALVSTSASRLYGPEDVRLGEELALRAALALENARLYRLAKKAIQAREDVLGIVAHDLRNPLSSILMQTRLLRRPGGAPERRSRDQAEAIERAARRMNRLIQDLLDVTRIEAGRLSIERERVAAAELVVDSFDAQKALASSSSIELKADLAQELPEVWGDRDRLLQVFENLIGNAIKFTKPGGRISVGAAPRDGEILFSVADTGTGIDAADLPHVFDEFWQAKHGKSAGAGLGLSIVRGIVETHGGRVWVESTLGRGTTFFFTIPTAARGERRGMLVG